MRLKKYLNEIRIINSKEKAKDIDGRVIRPGDIIKHDKFGRGQIKSIDIKSYSIPIVTIEIHTGKFKNETIARSANEFRKIS